MGAHAGLAAHVRQRRGDVVRACAHPCCSRVPVGYVCLLTRGCPTHRCVCVCVWRQGVHPCVRAHPCARPRPDRWAVRHPRPSVCALSLSAAYRSLRGHWLTATSIAFVAVVGWSTRRKSERSRWDHRQTPRSHWPSLPPATERTVERVCLARRLEARRGLSIVESYMSRRVVPWQPAAVERVAEPSRRSPLDGSGCQCRDRIGSVCSQL